MPTLTGHPPQDNYKNLLQVSNDNFGIDASVRTVEDGEGTPCPLQISTDKVNIDSGFQIGGVDVTATAAFLNLIVGYGSSPPVSVSYPQGSIFVNSAAGQGGNGAWQLVEAYGGGLIWKATWMVSE